MMSPELIVDSVECVDDVKESAGQIKIHCDQVGEEPSLFLALFGSS